jgi:YegS/Rv2252/BmrU family lipid kinase
VIAGGDGTVSQAIGSLMKFDVNFGILPCGSGNGLAHAAKIPSQPGKALDLIFSGTSRPTDGFYINGQFACMLCGLGFDAKVAHDFAKQPKRGLSTYVKQVIRNFFSAKSYSFDIKLPQHSFSTEAFFISIANANQFGNNFTIAPKASLNDGLLDIVIVAEQMKLNMLLQTLKQVTGINKLQTGTIVTENRGVVYFQTDKLQVTNKSLAPLHIDGDPAATAKKFEIAINKDCFRLLRP